MQPIEWAIQDYKRREQKHSSVPNNEVTARLVENTVDVGSLWGLYEPPRSRNKAIRRSIIRTHAAIPAHISPYKNGLAPETHDFVAWLNAEAEEDGIDVRFIALANRIEIAGDIGRAANTDTVFGWFLRQARSVGFFQGEEPVLVKDNSYHRKYLRKLAKRKPK